MRRLHLCPMMEAMQHTMRCTDGGTVLPNLTRKKEMKTANSTTLRKSLFVALAALSMGTAAIGAQAQSASTGTAQTTPQAGRYAHAANQEQRAAHAAARTARLHDELKITPAQENAWNAFVASMKPPARTGQGASQDARPERAAWAGLSAPQRMAKHIDMQKQRTAAMEQRLASLNSFYAVLTPDQKKTFDDKAGHFKGHGMRHGGWQRGGDTARG